MSQPHITILDVAKKAGTSKATASRALSGNGSTSKKTREKVWQAARELGFVYNVAAQQLASGERHGEVALFALHLDLGVVTNKLQLLQRKLYDLGYFAPIYAFSTQVGSRVIDQAELLGNICRLCPRALVLNTNQLNQDACNEVQKYIDRGGCVIAYDGANDFNCDKVLFDRYQNTYVAARHLLDLGHRNIGFYVGGWPVVRNNPRLEGFKAALEEFDAPFGEEWLTFADNIHNRKGDNIGVDLGEFYLQLENRPTAMCIVNDFTASAFINTVREAGLRVPEDVSVVSHDNLPFADSCAPLPLTTMSHPVQHITDAAVELLVDRLENDYSGPPRIRTVHGELITRKSTLPLPIAVHAGERA